MLERTRSSKLGEKYWKPLVKLVSDVTLGLVDWGRFGVLLSTDLFSHPHTWQISAPVIWLLTVAFMPYTLQLYTVQRV